MPCAPLLTTTAASQAVSHSRFGDAGLTSRGVNAVLLLASCGRDPDRCDHRAALGRRGLWSRDWIDGEQHPGNPRGFVHQRNDGSVGASPFHQGTDLLTSAVTLALVPAKRGPGTVHEEWTQIPIPPCADPEQTQLAIRRGLAWYDPQPRGKRPGPLHQNRILLSFARTVRSSMLASTKNLQAQLTY
jgi:hypothetical protein